jgi:hypothetical protein
MTTGQLQSAVTDHAGRALGRYTGPQHLPGITFTVEAGERQQVPVLIGTDSLVPELGYAIPPGGWSLVVEIGAPDRLLSAPLPLTVTS